MIEDHYNIIKYSIILTKEQVNHVCVVLAQTAPGLVAC